MTTPPGGLAYLETLHVEHRHSYDERDTILYALAVGAGATEGEERELKFVYEDGLAALPSYALALAFTDMTEHYLRAGLTVGRLLHGEQSLEMHGAIAPSGRVVATTKGLGFRDQGPDRGLVYYYRTELDHEDGSKLATLHASTFCLDDGGKAASRVQAVSPFAKVETPGRQADGTIDVPTIFQQALLYRMSGDRNPIHIVPSLARNLGLPKPPLHGRCTFGAASLALIKACCGYDAQRLMSLTARFKAPAYPGETIRIDIWREDGRVLFQARALERDAVVLSHGQALIKP